MARLYAKIKKETRRRKTYSLLAKEMWYIVFSTQVIHPHATPESGQRKVLHLLINDEGTLTHVNDEDIDKLELKGDNYLHIRIKEEAAELYDSISPTAPYNVIRTQILDSGPMRGIWKPDMIHVIIDDNGYTLIVDDKHTTVEDVTPAKKINFRKY